MSKRTRKPKNEEDAMLMLLEAAGFITPEKVRETRKLVKSLKWDAPATRPARRAGAGGVKSA